MVWGVGVVIRGDVGCVLSGGAGGLRWGPVLALSGRLRVRLFGGLFVFLLVCLLRF